MSFKPNRKFKKKYIKLFKENPMAANVFLLLCELADKRGEAITSDEELAELMAVRFNDPTEYAFGETNG